MTTENIFASGKLAADVVKDLQQNFEGNILMAGDSGYENSKKSMEWYDRQKTCCHRSMP